ncbi:hypothetical protein [Geobacter sp. AOG1]|uniref:hypothetical protein n=1 Tax=Geobacter sp. AOG1 TaxID=1566346 RepID=UPI001CC59D88|nr:hypothetical protein [Geobacter sp. AOG1]
MPTKVLISSSVAAEAAALALRPADGLSVRGCRTVLSAAAWRKAVRTSAVELAAGETGFGCSRGCSGAGSLFTRNRSLHLGQAA